MYGMPEYFGECYYYAWIYYTGLCVGIEAAWAEIHTFEVKTI